MGKRNLYVAATKGQLERFQLLLRQEPHLIDEVSFSCSRNLLHIATMHMQPSIVEEVLRRSPRLARDVDSQKSSPLHIAAAQGRTEIASKLLEVAPETRWWRDGQGMNPVHVAAVNGYVEMLMELLRHDRFPALERVDGRQTVLHLCVRHRQLGALKVLAEKLEELVCAKDDDGETVLHLAVRYNQVEAVRWLVETKRIKKHTLNSTGKTALKILDETPTSHNHYSEMREILKGLSNQSMVETLPELTDMAMVVVVLIATMAFQAAVSPPGGVWQDDTSSHRAGDAVMATTHPKVYKHFVRANTTAFVSSLITIFLITTRLPSGRVHFVLIAVLAMWMSMASVAVSFGASVMVVTPGTERRSPLGIVVAVVAASLGIMGFIFVSNRVRQYYLHWKSQKRRRPHSGDGDGDGDVEAQRAPEFPRFVNGIFNVAEKAEDAIGRRHMWADGLIRLSKQPRSVIK